MCFSAIWFVQLIAERFTQYVVIAIYNGGNEHAGALHIVDCLSHVDAFGQYASGFVRRKFIGRDDDKSVPFVRPVEARCQCASAFLCIAGDDKATHKAGGDVVRMAFQSCRFCQYLIPVRCGGAAEGLSRPESSQNGCAA